MVDQESVEVKSLGKCVERSRYGLFGGKGSFDCCSHDSQVATEDGAEVKVDY